MLRRMKAVVKIRPAAAGFNAQFDCVACDLPSAHLKIVVNSDVQIRPLKGGGEKFAVSLR